MVELLRERVSRYRMMVMCLQLVRRNRTIAMGNMLRNYRLGRRLWTINRPQLLFEEKFTNTQPDIGYWNNIFRMSRETFLKTVDITRVSMAHTDTFVCAPIPTHKRVAIVLHWLATGNTLHSVGWQRGTR